MFKQRAPFISLSALTDEQHNASAHPPHSHIHTLTGESSRLDSIAFPLNCASGFHRLWADRIPTTEAACTSEITGSSGAPIRKPEPDTSICEEHK